MATHIDAKYDKRTANVDNRRMVLFVIGRRISDGMVIYGAMMPNGTPTDVIVYETDITDACGQLWVETDYIVTDTNE